MTAEPETHRSGCGDREAALMRALTRALRKLGEAGEVDAASRIAAQAWSDIRHTDPDAAERLNGTMHYLARLPDPVAAPHNHARDGSLVAKRAHDETLRKDDQNG